MVGVPIRYMHTPGELLDLLDVERCARLMAAYCRLVTPDTDFTPRRRRA
jgi:putative aminopeptidase FrvX